MQIALTVLEIVAPVFILAAVGFAWVRLGYEYRLEFVTRFAMTLSVPCLIFTALMQTEIEASALATLSLASFAAYGAVTLVTWGLVALLGLEQRTFLAPLIFGNTATSACHSLSLPSARSGWAMRLLSSQSWRS